MKKENYIVVTTPNGAHVKQDWVCIASENELTADQLHEIAKEVNTKPIFWRNCEPYGYWFFDFQLRSTWVESNYKPDDPIEPIQVYVGGVYEAYTEEEMQSNKESRLKRWLEESTVITIEQE